MSSIPKDELYPRLLLKTVFSTMVCDGKIDESEVALIKNLANDKGVFGELDIDDELESLIVNVNDRGLEFFDDFFKLVDRTDLTEEEELQMLELAIMTIRADRYVREEEINFLKILRTRLQSQDQHILDKFPDIASDFIHKDNFTEIYIKELYQNYFKQKDLPQFDITDVKDISDEIDFGAKE